MTGKLAAALCSISMFALAADWPQWLGPTRNGISQETGLLEQWPQAGPKLRWKTTGLGDGYGTVAIAGGRAYLVSNQGNEDENLRAMSVEDGKTLWIVRLGKLGNPNQDPPYPASRSTPSVDGDAVYAFSSDGDLVCVETATGKVRWKIATRQEYGGEPHKWAYAESPLVDGDAVIVTPGGSQATMVAVNKKTGKLIWKAAIPGGEAPGYASAIIVNAAGHKQYVQFLSKGVVGVDAKSGAMLWRYDETSKGPANIPTPVADGEYVYSTARSISAGALVKLQGKPDGGVSAEQVYMQRGLPSTIGGSVKVGDIIYGTTGEGLVAAEFLTGKVRWTNESVGPASVLYAQGHVVVYGENGEVALVEATPDAYREKGRFTTPDKPAHPRGPRERSWAYPVLANGRLYLRDLGVLWCYDVRK